MESIKAYGNAVVPQLVKIIFEAIEEYEFTRTSRASVVDSGTEDRSFARDD